MDNLIFIGMPAAGKSVIGAAAAKKLGYGFIDSDLLIQEQEGAPLEEIIGKKGIEGFLKIENQVNAGINGSRMVIATGGSAVYCEEAMRHFKEIGKIVYLQCTCETIEGRIENAGKRGVVLRKGQTLKDLYNERIPLFESYADVTLCVDGITTKEAAEKVKEAVLRLG